MKTDDRARYKNIGDEGDILIAEKVASLAGLGSVGSSVAAMLARENVELRLVDRGRVEEDEMHRLALFVEEDITRFKVKQAKIRIAAINPNAQVKSFHEEISDQNTFLLQGDVVIDATNNPEINPLILAHASAKGMPLIVVRYSGDVARIAILQKKAPAKFLEKLELPLISDAGVFGPVTTMAASVVVAETLKVLLGSKTSCIIEIDAWTPALKITKL